MAGEAPAPQPLVGGSETHTQTAAPIAAQQPELAPYGAFVLSLLSSSLLVSVMIFNVADALARQRWEATASTAVATLAAILLARSAWKAWGQVIQAETETDANLKRRHRNVLVTGLVIAVLFFIISATVGTAIGQNRVEASQLEADLGRMAAVGDRMTKTRSAVDATIPSYVQMYKAIEPDVEDFELTLLRLRAELDVYDAKFPNQHPQTLKTIAGVETGLRRAALLKQQIAAAKQIEFFGSSEQWTLWQSQVQPLLDKEDALRQR